jgi:hypothetical protein
MKSNAKGSLLLGCIDEEIGAGGICHGQLTIFVVLFSSHHPVGISNSYMQNKKHRKHLMTK